MKRLITIFSEHIIFTKIENEILSYRDTRTLSVSFTGDVIRELQKDCRTARRLRVKKTPIKSVSEYLQNFDWVNPDISHNSFFIETKPHDRTGCKFALMHFNGIIRGSEVVTIFKHIQFERPVVFDTFLFTDQYPDICSQFPVVFLHEPWRDPDGSARVLATHGGNPYLKTPFRDLGLCWYSDIFFPEMHFLGIEKRSSV